MNNRTTPQTQTLASRLQSRIATAAAAALNRTRIEAGRTAQRLTTLPDGTAFAWTPIIVRPRSLASRWIE